MATTELGTILIVEDDPGVAVLERRCLEQAGYTTLCATNAAEALAVIQRGQVDLIILDYALPDDVNGLEFYEAIRAAGYCLPVVMVTGFAEETTVIRALRAGVRDFVSKSLTYLEYLPEAVGRVLRQIDGEKQLTESQAKLHRSEQELIDFFDNAVIGMHLVNSDGVIVRANRAEFALLGYSREEYIGHHISEFHADQEVIADMLRRLQRGEVLRDCEVRLRCKDGSLKHVQIDSNSLWENGKLIYSRCCARDITAWKRSQDALRESESRFRQLAENIDEVFWMTSTDGRQVLYASPAYETIWGRRCEELLERPEAWLESVLAEDRDRVRQVWQEYLKTSLHGKYEDEFRIIGSDGSVRWVKNRGFAVYDEHGQACRIAGVAEDVTLAKWTEQRMARHTEELARSNAELEQFAYVASHDLQEPLRKITSFCQLLREHYANQLDADAKQYIAYAVDGAKRMKQLITHLLDYSRIGRQGEPMAATDSQAACARALENLQAAIDESGATIFWENLPVVIGNDAMLVRLFQNLIGNALKFRGERRPEIHVTAVREDDHWLFSVQDNGIGIAPEYWTRIFAVFQRLHSAAEYNGTGIGLAVCKRIVERLGGRIWIESEPGRGSTFYFTLACDKKEQQGLKSSLPRIGLRAQPSARCSSFRQEQRGESEHLVQFYESDAQLATEADRMRAISQLQQKAQTLEAERAIRRKAEKTLVVLPDERNTVGDRDEQARPQDSRVQPWAAPGSDVHQQHSPVLCAES